MTTYNTGNPLGSTSPKDLYDNAENFDNFANGGDPFYPDRLGEMRRSISGMNADFNLGQSGREAQFNAAQSAREVEFQDFLEASGFVSLGNYAPGLNFTLYNQYMARGGFFYRPAPSSLPFTTTGTWDGADEDLFVLFSQDAVLRQDLEDDADPAKGPGIVGFGEGVAYPPSTVGSKLQSLSYTPYAEGAVGDGVADDTAAVLAWAASTDHTRKHWGDGIFKVGAEVVFNPGDYVTGNAANSVVDCSAGIGGATRCLSVTGSVTALPALASSVGLRTNVLEFSSAPGLVTGDVVLIWNPTNASWSGWRPDYRAGEWCRVASVSGTTVTVYGLTYDNYAPGDVQLYKLEGKQVVFKDFVIKQPFTSNAGLHIEFIDSPVIENVFSSGAVYAGMSVQKCVDIDIQCRPQQGSTASGNNYGLAIGNTQGGQVRGHYYGTRHSISLGGATGIGSVSCRNLDVYASMSNLQSLIGAQDLHGNTEDIRFFGGTFTGGGIVAGKNNKFSNCNFIGRGGNGIALLMGEVKGGTFEFTGCRFESDVDPNTIGGQGILSFQNLTANVVEECHFVFTGTTIKCPAATTFPIIFALNGTSAKINVSFNGGLTFLAAAAVNQVLRLRQFGATGSFGTVSMKEVSGLPATACPYVVEVGAPTIEKYRLPRQIGRVTVPVTNAASTFSVAMTYAHAYPRAPFVVANHQNPTVGGKRITSGYTSSGAPGFTAVVQSTDSANFGSAADALVAWVAELEDQ